MYLNNDGSVSGADPVVLLVKWGSEDSAADLNHDSIVNGVGPILLLCARGCCGAFGTTFPMVSLMDMP